MWWTKNIAWKSKYKRGLNKYKAKYQAIGNNKINIGIYFLFRYRSKNSSGSSSIGVIHTEGECLLDGFFLDPESEESCASLNSTCSLSSHFGLNDVNALSIEQTNG